MLRSEDPSGKIPDSHINNGWFAVPHYVYTVPIPPIERRLMVVLLKLENRYAKTHGKWFYISNKKIMDLENLSEKSLIRARASLVGYGWIEHKKGYSHHSSQYRILLRGYGKEDPMKTAFRRD